MSGALITDAGAVTMAAAAAAKAVPAGEGSAFVVRNAALTTSVKLTDVWRKASAAGYVMVKSPNLVPVSNGIRIQTPTGLADFLLGGPPFQRLIPQDSLAITDLGGDSDTDGVAIQSYYDSLPGGAMVLKSPGDISGSTDFVFGWPCDATAAATAGDQGGTLITNTVDSSMANTWYAVLGYQVDTDVLAVGISGVDTSQLFCGGPGDTSGSRTRNYFMDLSQRLSAPCIPLFNSANKGATNIVVVDNAASTAVNVTLILAQLSDKYTP